MTMGLAPAFISETASAKGLAFLGTSVAGSIPPDTVSNNLCPAIVEERLSMVRRKASFGSRISPIISRSIGASVSIWLRPSSIPCETLNKDARPFSAEAP